MSQSRSDSPRDLIDAGSSCVAPSFSGIAQQIGVKLREVYASPETEPLPVEHVDLLLRLRHKERDEARRRKAA